MVQDTLPATTSWSCTRAQAVPSPLQPEGSLQPQVQAPPALNTPVTTSPESRPLPSCLLLVNSELAAAWGGLSRQTPVPDGHMAGFLVAFRSCANITLQQSFLCSLPIYSALPAPPLLTFCLTAPRPRIFFLEVCNIQNDVWSCVHMALGFQGPHVTGLVCVELVCVELKG